MVTKCPACGVDNLDGAQLCRACGKPFALIESAPKSGAPLKDSVELRRKNEARARKAMAVESTFYGTIPEKLKFEYSHGAIDPAHKSQEGIQSLLAHFRKPKIDIDGLLSEAANLISRQYGIADVAIGLRDPKDGLYRYKAMVGFRNHAIEAHKTITYTKEQFYDGCEFKGTDISKYSRIYLEEDNISY